MKKRKKGKEGREKEKEKRLKFEISTSEHSGRHSNNSSLGSPMFPEGLPVLWPSSEELYRDLLCTFMFKPGS